MDRIHAAISTASDSADACQKLTNNISYPGSFKSMRVYALLGLIWCASAQTLVNSTVGCCHGFGYGDLMKRCCDTYTNTTNDECVRLHPRHLVGGGCEWLPQPCGINSVGVNNGGGVENVNHFHPWHWSVEGMAGVAVGAVIFIVLVSLIGGSWVLRRRQPAPVLTSL